MRALAAKSRQAEKILIPVLDILQSVPILGFLSITVTGFIALFPGRLLGVECAAIFAIFTSQAWNMTFSVYQSLRTRAGRADRGGARCTTCRPGSASGGSKCRMRSRTLVWNMMMSVSGGWFFVVASEAITVAGQTILLPGIGSYIATAIAERDLGAIGYAVLIMLIVILLYDQLLFRPLLGLVAQIPRRSPGDEDNVRPWFLIVLQRARLFDLLHPACSGAQPARADRRRLARGCRARLPARRSPAASSPASSGCSISRCWVWRSPARLWLVRVHPRERAGRGDRLGVSCSA